MEKILDLFLEKDGMRKWMRSPFTNADKKVIFATDGIAMICINNNGCENDFENYEDKIKGTYPVGCSNCNISISFEELQAALNKIKPVINQIKHNHTHTHTHQKTIRSICSPCLCV